jgi:geranylgeranyl pyrophosphate synthase/predicted secreted hydrolase
MGELKRRKDGVSYPNEAPHPEAPLEWWFVQGTYQGERIGQHHFMTCLFKHRISRKTNPPYSFSSIQTVLDCSTNNLEIDSDVDQNFVPLIQSNIKSLKKVNLNPRYLDLLIADLEKHGPPREIALNSEPVHMQSAPFRISRGPFLLGQISTGFQLNFSIPPLVHSGEFRLRPTRDRLHIGEALNAGGKGRGMHYFSYPRMELKGNVDGEPVTGQAWFDHQWGKYYVVKGDKAKYSVLGWDWFGINFDDGSDWVVGLHRDAETGRIIHRYLYAVDPDGHTALLKNFSVRPIGHWESSRTLIRHPVKWRIDVPELEALVVFQPHVPDQEIPVLGLMRAIWEGSGTVQGTKGGNPVSGRARGEFQGYGFVFDYGKILKRIGMRVEKRIEHFLPKKLEKKTLYSYLGRPKWKLTPEAYTPMLAEPFWELMSRKGKMWRPAFGFMLLNALGVDPQPFESFICNMAELSHVGSLIIDDIEDDSLLRRGKESIHLLYGESVAINAANTLYFLPMLELIDHSHLSKMQQLEIHQVLVKQFVRAHFGQALDIYWSREIKSGRFLNILQDSPLPKVLQMYEYKSAAIVEGLAETAAIIAGVTGPQRQTCIDFARDFGVVFQIIDDVHNFSKSDRWRKECGEDLRESKPTYVIIQALRKLCEPERTRLLQIWAAHKQDLKHKNIREGVELVRQSGILETCRQDAHSIFSPSKKRFKSNLPFSEAKIFLLSLCENLLNIDFD